YFILLVVLGAGVFNVGNLFLTNYGLERVEAVLASNLFALELIFALLIGFLFYRELPNLKEIFGGVLILFSVVQMNKLE
ncbi:MAG: EamA family transporter, partial [Patescibacteria group bacterium]